MEECGRMNVLFAAFAGNKSVLISAEEIGWTSFYVRRSLASMKCDKPHFFGSLLC